MKRILVAGAGHGGLTAAINLAKNGYDVTVIEEKQRDEMGHDWEDFLDMSAFDMSGIARPAEDTYSSSQPCSFRNPSATRCIEFSQNTSSVFMDRKVLMNYLMECAELAEVKFLFGHKVVSPIVHSAAVKGLNISDGEKNHRMTADLVIDAAGMYSPVRTNLPVVCGIQQKLEPKDVFHVYRAYYDNPSCQVTKPGYIIDLFHMNRPGIDWTITHGDHIDILIGKFGESGELTQEEVDATVAAYRNEYPFFTEKIVRGGVFADIPLTKMLPMIVCDGYAAVGDSAGMTTPLSGSGIVLSMRAGKILADAVIKSGGDFSRKALWRYEYEYFRTLGQKLIVTDTLKNFAAYINSEQIDIFLEDETLSADVRSIAGRKKLQITPKNLRHILWRYRPVYKLFSPAVKNFKSLPLVPLVCKTIPKKYDENRVNSWVKMYRAV